MAVLASDLFNRANGGLGANWTVVTGCGVATIVSNAVQPQDSTSPDSVSYWNGVAWPDDQYAQVKVVVANTDITNAVGATVRCAAGSTTFYRGLARGPLGASATVDIKKNVGGTTTTLATGTVAVVTGDVLKLQASGTAISTYINGVQVHATQTDSAISTGGAGLMAFCTGANSNSVLDEWEGGSVDVAGPPADSGASTGTGMQRPVAQGWT